MTFEEAGRALDRELGRLVEFLEHKVKTARREDVAPLLRKASERLGKLAEDLEKPASSKPRCD